jgi:hypothetical protein
MPVAPNDDWIRHNGRVRPNKAIYDNVAVVVERGNRNNNGVTTHNENTTSPVAATSKYGTAPSQHFIIDNTQNIYIPIRLPCGIKVMFHQDIFEQPKWFKQIQTILQTDVSYCLRVLPVSVRCLVRRTNIWLNLKNYYYHDPQTNQTIYVNHTTTHHHVAWLLWYVVSIDSYIVYFVLLRICGFCHTSQIVHMIVLTRYWVSRYIICMIISVCVIIGMDPVYCYMNIVT